MLATPAPVEGLYLAGSTASAVLLQLAYRGRRCTTVTTPATGQSDGKCCAQDENGQGENGVPKALPARHCNPLHDTETCFSPESCEGRQESPARKPHSSLNHDERSACERGRAISAVPRSLSWSPAEMAADHYIKDGQFTCAGIIDTDAGKVLGEPCYISRHPASGRRVAGRDLDAMPINWI